MRICSSEHATLRLQAYRCLDKAFGESSPTFGERVDVWCLDEAVWTSGTSQGVVSQLIWHKDHQVRTLLAIICGGFRRYYAFCLGETFRNVDYR